MGLHTGGAEQSGESLVGLGINRAARIAALAHGGQILASSLIRDQLVDHPVDGVTLRDLGDHRLKDLSAPVRIVQVIADGLPADFPALRSLDARPNNLPTQLTTFIGRDAELEAAAGLLATTRLLTLTGPGGTGKTRLSLQLAARASDDFPDGVFFVPLEPIRDPMLVAPRIASALGVAESTARPIDESLADWLRDKRLLLVLDNFEQVVAAAPIVADLLRAAPEIKAIVTSRAVLHVSGEQEYPVPGLPAPPDPSQQSGLERLNLGGGTRAIDLVALGQYAAVRLFIERAVAVQPGVQRSPTRTRRRSPRSARASTACRSRSSWRRPGSSCSRQTRSSSGSITSSTSWRPGPATCPSASRRCAARSPGATTCSTTGGKRLLDRLSVFASGCDLASAEAVCGPASEIGGDILDGLMALVDQSLVKVEETADGEPRFRLLDTIREYAAERLEADGEADLIRDRHRDWYVALVERAAGELSGADQRRWLDRLELEHDDIRAVLDRAVAAPDPPVAIGVAFSMWRFWQKHGHLAEARRRLEAMAAAPWSHDDPRLRAKLMEALGGTCWWQGDLPAMSAVLPRGARDLAGARTTRPSSPTPTTTPRSPTPSTSGSGRRTTADDGPDRAALPRAGARHLPPHRRPARRGQRGLGPRQLPLLPASPRQRGGAVPRDADDLPRSRRPDDGGLGPAHARDLAAAQRAASTRRGATSPTPSATSMRPATHRA